MIMIIIIKSVNFNDVIINTIDTNYYDIIEDSYVVLIY